MTAIGAVRHPEEGAALPGTLWHSLMAGGLGSSMGAYEARCVGSVAPRGPHLTAWTIFLYERWDIMNL